MTVTSQIFSLTSLMPAAERLAVWPQQTNDRAHRWATNSPFACSVRSATRVIRLKFFNSATQCYVRSLLALNVAEFLILGWMRAS